MPVAGFADKQALKELIHSFPGYQLILDGIYNNPDEEYQDIRIIESFNIK